MSKSKIITSYQFCDICDELEELGYDLYNMSPIDIPNKYRELSIAEYCNYQKLIEELYGIISYAWDQNNLDKIRKWYKEHHDTWVWHKLPYRTRNFIDRIVKNPDIKYVPDE